MALGVSNIEASRRTTSGTVHAARSRLKGAHVTTTTAGSVIFKDGGSGGTTLLHVDVGPNFSGNIYIPNDGILFETSLYIALTNVTSATVFHQA